MVFEFFEARDSMRDPRLEEGWSSSYWRTEHPMGIVGAHYTLVSDDGPAATRFLVDALGGSLIHTSVVPWYGTRSSFVALSAEVVIEVAEPDGSDLAAAEDLARGGAFHTVTFRVADLDRAVSHVESKGIAVDRPADGHAALDPRDTMGMLLRLTERDISEW